MPNPDQMIDKMPLRETTEQEQRNACLTTAWFNRDTPEDIADMLEALGLKSFAEQKMRRTA